MGVLRARLLLRVVLLSRHRRHALDHAAARAARSSCPAALVLESISSSFSSVAGPALGGHPRSAFVGLTSTYAFDLVDVRRRDREHLRAAARSARRGRGPPEPALDRRRFPLRHDAAGRARLHARRRERDDLRDADGALPGDRDAPVRRPAPRRLPLRGAVRRRAASSLASGWIPHVRRQGLAVAVAASRWGIAIAAFGFSETLWLGLLLLALAGAADNISAVFRSTIMLSATPENMRGRLTGIEFAQVASAPTLGNVEAGVVASLTSLRFSIVSGGIAVRRRDGRRRARCSRRCSATTRSATSSRDGAAARVLRALRARRRARADRRDAARSTASAASIVEVEAYDHEDPAAHGFRGADAAQRARCSDRRGTRTSIARTASTGVSTSCARTARTRC